MSGIELLTPILALKHACLTTTEPELPSKSLFADDDPCLFNHELQLINPFVEHPESGVAIGFFCLTSLTEQTSH